MPRLGVREWTAVGRVFAHGNLLRTTSGLRMCERFESELAQQMGVGHSLGVNSGTAALVCSLQALGIGPGDQVLVSAYTWMASAAAVVLVGAVPVLVEIDATLTMDPEDLRAKITPHSRAVIPVHMINRPCDMDRILSIAAEHHLAVLEDSCQAIGVRYKGRACGTMGDMGAFSFNQAKNMTCGEGGAILTNSEELYERAYFAHDMGVNFRTLSLKRRDQEFVGGNYRMSEIEGAIMRVQLSKLPRRLKRMRRRVKAITEVLERAGFPLAPHSDPDNAMSVAVTFPTEAEAIAFAKNRAVRRLYDTSKHVFTEWTAIRERRMPHPRFDPWAWSEPTPLITKDTCPRTLDLMRRSCVISPMIEWPMPVALAQARRIAASKGQAG